MKISSIFSALVLGLTTVNAIPSQYNALTSRDHHTSTIEQRAKKPTAPVTITVDSATCLNVPQTYAAYMETATGKYERYQCDSGSMPYHENGTIIAVSNRQMATKELLVCMDINLISRTGVIKAHIPPSVCPAVVGYRGPDAASSGATQDYIALKYALKTLMRSHGAKMGRFVVAVVHGPDKGFTEADTKLILNDIFALDFKKIPFQAVSQAANGGITRVDLSPPALFVDGKKANIRIPS